MTKATDLGHLRSTSANTVARVVASADSIHDLEQQLADRFQQPFAMMPMDPATAISQKIIGDADILILEVDPASPHSLSRIQQVREMSPDTLIIAAVMDLDVGTVRTLLRRGLNDVVSLPFNAEELVSAVIELGSMLPESSAELAPMSGIVHATGGVGASTLVSHLAEAVTNTASGTRCCIVDLDLQFGEIASLFGQSPITSVIDCLEAGVRMDFDLVSNALVDTGRDIFLLPAPMEVMPPETVDTDQLLRLLTLLRKNFDYVLVDFPSSWSEATLSAAAACTELLVVVEQSVRTLSRARKMLALFDTVDFAPEGVQIVLNKAEKKMFQAIGTDEVETAMGRNVVAALPLVKPILGQLQEQGVLLGDQDGRAPFVKAVDELADVLVARGGGTV